MLLFLPGPPDRSAMTRLILMCGLPGAGKTTQARRLAATLPAIRLSPDEWLTGLGLSLFDIPARDRVEQLLWQHAQQLLRLGQDVILENGFWARTERDGYRDTARALGATVHLHYLDTPLDVLKHRRRDLLTAAQMDDCAALFEAPGRRRTGHLRPTGHPGHRAVTQYSRPTGSRNVVQSPGTRRTTSAPSATCRATSAGTSAHAKSRCIPATEPPTRCSNSRNGSPAPRTSTSNSGSPATGRRSQPVSAAPEIRLAVEHPHRDVQAHLIHQAQPHRRRPHRLARPRHHTEQQTGRGAAHHQPTIGEHPHRTQRHRPRQPAPPRHRCADPDARAPADRHHLHPQIRIPAHRHQRREHPATAPRRQPRRPGHRHPERLRVPRRRIQEPGHPTNHHNSPQEQRTPSDREGSGRRMDDAR